MMLSSLNRNSTNPVSLFDPFKGLNPFFWTWTPQNPPKWLLSLWCSSKQKTTCTLKKRRATVGVSPVGPVFLTRKLKYSFVGLGWGRAGPFAPRGTGLVAALAGQGKRLQPGKGLCDRFGPLKWLVSS